MAIKRLFLIIGTLTALATAQTDMRSVKDFGAKGNGIDDDTAAIQSALNYFGSPAGKNLSGELFCPQGTYKITNTLVYEGNNGIGLHFLGAEGADRGPAGCHLKWQGPANGVLFLALGANGSFFEFIDFDGAQLAKYVLRIDATNEYHSSSAWNISSISRASNVVTVNTTASHNIGAGDIVKIAGVANSAYNGTFLVQYSNGNKTFSYLQSGPDTSSTEGTATRYKSAPSSGLKVRSSSFSGFQSLTGIALKGNLVRANGTVRVTTVVPHYLVPGDNFDIAGASDSSFNNLQDDVYNTVVTVPSATTFTYFDGRSDKSIAALGAALTTESSGISVAHYNALSTEQVSELEFHSIFVQGQQTRNGSYNCVKWNNGGNVKNFQFFGGGISGCQVAFAAPNSGTFGTHGVIIGNMTKRDYWLGSGTYIIDSNEIEDVGSRFVFGSPGANQGIVTLINNSWQSAASTDDVVISYGGALVLIGNQLFNLRTGTSIPKIERGGLFGDGTNGSIVSIGNFYQHVASGQSPFMDANGNRFGVQSSYYTNQSPAVSSFYDSGGTGGQVTRLSNKLTLKSLISQQTSGNLVPFGCLICMGAGDSIKFRNNAAGADISGLTKDSSDVVQCGDAPGCKATLLTETGGIQISGPTARISAGSCAKDTSAIYTGAAATTAFSWSFNATPPATYNSLNISVYPTNGHANLHICNPSTGAIAPEAATFNIRALN